MIRAVVFRLHLAAAVAAGAVIVVMAVTGVVLSLEGAAIALAERRDFVAAGADARRLGPGEIVAAAEGARDGAAGSGSFSAATLRYRADPRAPVRVGGLRGGWVDVDPYAGRMVRVGPGRMERFFDGVRAWHRWLAFPGGSVRLGRAVTGAANAVFLFLIVTGPLLWVPRPVTRRSLARGLRFAPGAKGAWRDLNWHMVAGIWAAAPLAVIAGTGLAASYPATFEGAYPVVGRVVGGSGAVVAAGVDRGGGVHGGGGEAAGEAALAAELDAALAVASAGAPGWRTMILTVPRGGRREVRVEVRSGGAEQPHKTARVVVDGATGAATEWETFADASPGRRGQLFLRHAHTGGWWGAAGQLVAGVASLAAVAMIWSGLSLAVRRLRRFARGRRAG